MSLAFRLVYAAAAWLAFSHLQGHPLDALTFSALVGALVVAFYVIDVVCWVSRELVVVAKERIA